MILDVGFYLMAVPLVLVVGMSKGGFGGGLGLLAVPLMSLMIDPRLAAAIMLPILCAMDAVGLWKFRGEWDRRNLKLLIPGALLGTALGAASFTLTNAHLIRIFVGLIALYFVFHYMVGQKRLAEVKAAKAKPVAGALWGCLAGFASYIAHAGGPPIAVYLVPQRLSKSMFVGTTILFFALINFAKLIPYSLLGQINLSSFISSLILLPLAPLGVYIGLHLHKRVSESLFYKITCYLLLLAGIKLVYEGVIGLIH